MTLAIHQKINYRAATTCVLSPSSRLCIYLDLIWNQKGRRNLPTPLSCRMENCNDIIDISKGHIFHKKKQTQAPPPSPPPKKKHLNLVKGCAQMY